MGWLGTAVDDAADGASGEGEGSSEVDELVGVVELRRIMRFSASARAAGRGAQGRRRIDDAGRLSMVGTVCTEIYRGWEEFECNEEKRNGRFQCISRREVR